MLFRGFVGIIGVGLLLAFGYGNGGQTVVASQVQDSQGALRAPTKIKPCKPKDLVKGKCPWIAYIGRASSGQTDVYTLDPTTGVIEQLTNDPEFDFTVSWDPTRVEIAFGSERNGQRDIWAVGRDGSGLRQVNNDPVLDQSPAWSPDGAAIAFEHLVSSNQIWRMTSAGTGLTLLSALPLSQRPRWFPSGSQIAFDVVTNLSPPIRELWIMNADGSNKQPITTSGGLKFIGDVSPDGQRIVFAWRLPPAAEDIYVINVNGTGLQQLTADPALDFNPVWSPDGSEIAFVIAGRNRLEQIVRRRRGIHAALGFAPALFLLFDDGDDVVISALSGNGQRPGGVAVGIDTCPGVGAVLHEHTHHFRGPIEDSVVQAVASQQFRTGLEHRTHLSDVSGAHRVLEALDGDALDIRLELGPTVEAVRPREHELRVVQSERRSVRIVVVSVDLRNGVRLTSGESLEQFFRLAFELI